MQRTPELQRETPFDATRPARIIMHVWESIPEDRREQVARIREVRLWKIIEVPAGEAPLEIRLAWVGLTLPSLYSESEELPSRWGNEGKMFMREGVLVPTQWGISALESKDHTASEWFRDKNNFPSLGMVFGADEVEPCGKGIVIEFDDTDLVEVKEFPEIK